MWIFCQHGFASIKQHDRQPRLLVVRGRVKGDVERLLSVPACQVVEDTAGQHDYRFRTFADRNRVADKIAEQVREINYENFKEAIADKRRLSYYFGVWDAMYEMQERLGERKQCQLT